MNFGKALIALKGGKRVTREYPGNDNIYLILKDRIIYMCCTGDRPFPWLNSQVDLLAEDWRILDNE